MKRLMLLVVFVLVSTLTGCFKEETRTFAECEYRLDEVYDMENEDDLYELNEASMTITVITKDEYESEEYNVLASRYKDEYYRVAIVLIIDDVVYDDLIFYEIEGSSAYNNRYMLWYEFTYNEEKHQCLFRMDLSNFAWINDFEDSRANKLYVLIEEIEFDNINISQDFVTTYNHVSFSLAAQSIA